MPIDSPLKEVANAASGRTRSQIILLIVSIGTERIVPGIPHIQNQNTSEMTTRTRLRVNRLARSIGVPAFRPHANYRHSVLCADWVLIVKLAPWTSSIFKDYDWLLA
jgi:hypothetical protein